MLADAPPEKIRDYARRWGVLQICQHGLPASHNPQPVVTPSMMHGSWCRPVGEPGTFSESLESWRQFSRQANALLHLDAELYANKLGALEYWPILCEDLEQKMGWRRYSAATEYWQILPDGLKRIERTPGWDPPLWSSIDHPVLAREFFDMALNYWLELANVRPAFSSFEKAKRVMLRGGGLFGALVSHILCAVGRSKGLAFCTGCGSVYNPGRLPNSRRRNYCPDCRPRAQADASKDYRQCIANARELSANGMSVEEIADHLNRDPERVKKWVPQPRRRQPKISRDT